MRSKVFVTLLVTVYGAKHRQLVQSQRKEGDNVTRTVFGDVVEIITTDDDCAGHLRRHHATSEDTSADGHLTSEGALLVCSKRLPFERL